MIAELIEQARKLIHLDRAIPIVIELAHHRLGALEGELGAERGENVEQLLGGDRPAAVAIDEGEEAFRAQAVIGD